MHVLNCFPKAFTDDLTTGSWGYNRKARYDAYEKTVDLIHLLIETVAFNGNLLLNVGPRADGTMPPIFVDRLVGMGEWLEVSEAVSMQPVYLMRWH
jgi:alpha-L-fucosidase